MSTFKYVAFICNNSNLEEKIKNESEQYLDKFIVYFNPTDSQCEEINNSKHKKIVQVINSKNSSVDMDFKSKIRPTILLSISENTNISSLLASIFSTK